MKRQKNKRLRDREKISRMSEEKMEGRKKTHRKRIETERRRERKKKRYRGFEEGGRGYRE